MRTIRLYDARDFAVGRETELGADAFAHAVRVLRLKAGDPVVLFNGDGCDYAAVLTAVTKKSASALVTAKRAAGRESPLAIHLGQVMSRGDRMDFTVQKAAELGVALVTPLTSERCGVLLGDGRSARKRETLRKIAAGACEQCGRALIPEVRPPVSLGAFLREESPADETKIVMSPRGAARFADLPRAARYRILVGPEGGLTGEELDESVRAGYLEVRAGPRILRTETAALVALSILQARFGDI